MNHARTTVPHRADRPSVLGPALRRASGITLLLALALGVVTAPGCAGKHGNYTDAHYNAAKEKMGALKSGTEYQMAHQAFLAGDLKKAQRHVDYSIELNDRVPRSHVLRGRVMMEMGNIEQASLSFKQAETIDATYVDAQYFQGVLAERLMRPEEALAKYQQAASMDQANSQYPVAAAEMMIQMGRAPEAETYLLGCRDRFDHSPGIRQALGQLAMLRDDSKTAEQLFFEASLLAPNDQPIIEDLCHAQMSNGRFPAAETNLSKLLAKESNADRRDLRHLRAACLMQVNRPADARDEYLKLTKDEQGASDYEAWLGLARLSVALRDDMKLRDAAIRLVAIDANRPEGYVLRAIQLRKIGELQQARNALGRALAIKQDTDSLVLLGLIERDMGRPEGARAAFAQALKVDPNNPEATEMLGSLDAVAGAER
ncbi:MAG: tetratricopeptide repeat protein [Phycisphaerales bacterium]